MFSTSPVIALSTILIAVSYAAALPALMSPVRREVTSLTPEELGAQAPYTQFARAAYCPDGIANWGCGGACDETSGFEISTNGGDGSETQYYFIGYYPALSEIIVGHQGTDPTELESLLTDGNAVQTNLDTALFPGVGTDVQAHAGFVDQHALTATIVLDTVNALLESTGATTVTAVGHSLGGALAELDTLFLSLNLPEGITVKGRTFGTPRVGNPVFAELIDSNVPDFTRVNNREDLIPIIPGRGLGYAHPEGEVHIIDDGNAVACSGNDNADDAECQIQTVPNIFDGNIIDHLGPYEGIWIGTTFC